MRAGDRGRRRARRAARARMALALALTALAMLWGASTAGAQGPERAAEVALAERYAPVLRVQLPPEGDSCADGEPYLPIDIDTILDSDQVALRGPWDGANIVQVAPGARTLSRGLPGYHLDLAGDPLSPGCDYARWSARLSAAAPVTAYARAVAEPGHAGRIALQYWFYYLFNDWNNTHEGDWEMIQIIFPADTAAQALATSPLEVGYSQHSSAERAAWDDPKLERIGDTHPVVYPAAGSHANFFSPRVFLMRSEAEGVGCDDAGGDARTVRPGVASVPQDRAAYLRAFPWLGFEGRWGERQAGPFNGPTGPNDKLSWTMPITWSQSAWRERSFSVPEGGGVAGTAATDMFCGAVAGASQVLRRAKANPLPVATGVLLVIAMLMWGLARTGWRPVAPGVVRHRRDLGAVIATAAWTAARHPRLFVGIGAVFLPLGVVVTLLQWLLFTVTPFEWLLREAGERNAFVASLAVGMGVSLSALGLVAVQAATAHALAGLAEDRPVGVLGAYRAVLARWRALVGSLAVVLVAQLLLDLTVLLIPVAVYLLVRWSLFAVAAGAGGAGAARPLHESSRAVRNGWWRTAAVSVGVTGAALLVGPAIGVLALIATGAAFWVVNLIAAVVYVVALPVAALAAAYLHGDLMARGAEREREATAVDTRRATPGAA